MNKALFYALMALVGGALLPAQTAWAQKRGDDGEGRERGEKPPSQNKSKLEQRYGEFAKAMAWELKTGKVQAEQIDEIIREFRRQADTTDRATLQAQIRELRAEARRANNSGDSERAQTLRRQMAELARSTSNVDPRMIYAIADVLSEPLLTDFWQIAGRFIGDGEIHPGALQVELLGGLDLTQDQAIAISRHYKVYLDEMRQPEHESSDSRTAVLTRFQDRLMEELNEEQRRAFTVAMEARERDKSKRDQEFNRRW